MARVTKIVLTCDVDGDGTAAEETVRFGLDGREYEIELCNRHHKELSSFMRSYVEKGRKVDGGSAPRRRRARSGAAAASGGGLPPQSAASSASGSAARAPRSSPKRKDDLQAIRSWGRAHGHKVSDRGRISAELSEAYAAAHR